MNLDKALTSLRDGVKAWNHYTMEQFANDRDEPLDGWANYGVTAANYHRDIARSAEIYLFWLGATTNTTEEQ